MKAIIYSLFLSLTFSSLVQGSTLEVNNLIKKRESRDGDVLYYQQEGTLKTKDQLDSQKPFCYFHISSKTSLKNLKTEDLGFFASLPNHLSVYKKGVNGDEAIFICEQIPSEVVSDAGEKENADFLIELGIFQSKK